MTILTKKQRAALFQLYNRPLDNGTSETYLQFRRKVIKASYDDCIMISWCNMWIGIETDGYTHS